MVRCEVPGCASRLYGSHDTAKDARKAAQAAGWVCTALRGNSALGRPTQVEHCPAHAALAPVPKFRPCAGTDASGERPIEDP